MARIVLVVKLNPRAGVFFRRDFTVVDDTLYFKATMQFGQEVWQYDATSLSILEEVNPGPKLSDPQYLTERDGALLFLAVAQDQCPVHRFDGHPSKEHRKRWGPLEVGGTFLTLRGNRSRGMDIQELRAFAIDGDGEISFLRSLVNSPAPFQLFNDDLYFS